MLEDNNTYPLDEVLTFAKDHAKDALDEERRREDSIISQANSMQTVFAVVTAALFIVAQISYDYNGPFSYNYLFVIFSMSST